MAPLDTYGHSENPKGGRRSAHFKRAGTEQERSDIRADLRAIQRRVIHAVGQHAEALVEREQKIREAAEIGIPYQESIRLATRNPC